MRILWLSDSPTVPSGFGNVTAFVCEGLARLGYDVHILGWQATEPGKPWKGATLHGAGWHPLGADVLLSHLYRLRPDVLITLADVWWLTFLTDPSLRQFFEMTSTRWLSYFPIDGHRRDGTLPPSWVEMLRRADIPVAMSRYGLRMTEASGVTCEYIPHGVDASTFSADDDPRRAKRRLGYEGRFVILSDARNQPRKMLPRLLTIFERFARDKPDALLHLHCDPNDPATEVSRYSYRIDADVRALGLSGRVRFTPGFGIRYGLPLADLVNVYRAADVHLLVSTGEGFGLPTLQAAACGVVPIAPDYSANPELVEGHGATIRVGEFVPDEFGIARAFVDIDDAVARLEAFYQDRIRLRASSLRARQFAESYDWSKVLPQWDAVLRRCVGPRSTVRRSGAPPVQTVAISHPASRPAWNRMVADAAAAGATEQAVRTSLLALPAGVSITLKVGEQRVGELARQVFDDARGEPGSPRLNVPIVQTEDGPADRVRKRRPGLVYLGPASGPASRNMFGALHQIFPVLRGWPATDESGASWFAALAHSILAIDLDGADPNLPLWAAWNGVPMIGLFENPWQRRLWPDLSVRSPAEAPAVLIARAVLTDFPTTASITAAARAALQRDAPWLVSEAKQLEVAAALVQHAIGLAPVGAL